MGHFLAVRCQIHDLLIKLQQTLREIRNEECEGVIVPKPDEDGLKMFILNVLKSRQYDSATPGWTLYDYAIGFISHADEKKEEFRNLAQPLVEYLRKHYHPHARIIIGYEYAEIVEGTKCEYFKLEENGCS